MWVLSWVTAACRSAMRASPNARMHFTSPPQAPACAGAASAAPGTSTLAASALKMPNAASRRGSREIANIFMLRSTPRLPSGERIASPRGLWLPFVLLRAVIGVGAALQIVHVAEVAPYLVVRVDHILCGWVRLLGLLRLLGWLAAIRATRCPAATGRQREGQHQQERHQHEDATPAGVSTPRHAITPRCTVVVQ